MEAVVKGSRDAVVAALRGAVDNLTKSQGADWGAVAVGPDEPQRVPASGRRRVRRAADGTSAAVRVPSTPSARSTARHQLRGPGRVDGHHRSRQLGTARQPVSIANLLELWGRNEFFPLLFTRPAVEAKTRHRLTLAPAREVQ